MLTQAMILMALVDFLALKYLHAKRKFIIRALFIYAEYLLPDPKYTWD